MDLITLHNFNITVISWIPHFWFVATVGRNYLWSKNPLNAGPTIFKCRSLQVFIPKCRRKVLYGQLRNDLGEVFRALARHKESRIEEGHLMVDHVHMLISIPPKYAVSSVMGYIKGKSAIHIARTYGERKRNFAGQHFWARGYFVSTVGRDEAMIRDYIRHQEQEDRRLDQLNIWS